MAAINPPAGWTTDQVLLPESLVDYFVFNSALTEGEPISVASATAPKATPAAPKSKTSKAKK